MQERAGSQCQRSGPRFASTPSPSTCCALRARHSHPLLRLQQPAFILGIAFETSKLSSLPINTTHLATFSFWVHVPFIISFYTFPPLTIAFWIQIQNSDSVLLFLYAYTNNSNWSYSKGRFEYIFQKINLMHVPSCLFYSCFAILSRFEYLLPLLLIL